MNKNVLLAVVAIIALAGGTVFILNYQKNKSNTTKIMDADLKNNTTTTQQDQNSAMPKTESSAMVNKESKRYLPYTKDAYNLAVDKKRVLYFHAKWCPVCGPIDKELAQNKDEIPADVVVFKTDYDTQESLKTKYGITYQHTFVQVDAQGNEVTTWSGGGLDELIKNIK